MKKINPYDFNFYNGQIHPSYQSAKIIVPFLIKYFNPSSVIDVGCGMGTWLKSFIEYGVSDVIGIDGNYINVDRLLIQKENFLPHNLRSSLVLDRKFDLAISLEVAEHLPSKSADIFIDSLTNLSSIIYFSAGIPFQGGTDHINEQWQSYWATKFQERNFGAYDIIRPVIWGNSSVQACYAQNGIVYINIEELNVSLSEKFSKLKPSEIQSLSVVHPTIYEDIIDPQKQTVRNQFKYFLNVLGIRLKKRLIK